MIKIPKLYKFNSAHRGIKSPSYNAIESALYNEINKIFPKDIVSFETSPSESIYYNTLNNANFLLYKADIVIIFQFENLAKIQTKYGNIILCDSTFYSSLSFSSQLFITRILDEKRDAFCTTSFTLMKRKSTDEYLKLFKVIHNNVNQYLPISEDYKISELHSILKLE